MASLSPQLSRSNSQSNLNSSDYESSNDGYDYNMVDDGPEREPTRRNVSSLEIMQRDANAPRRSDEPDHAFTETAPHIWQRHAGGRRAKLPEDLENGILDDTMTNGIALTELKPVAICGSSLVESCLVDPIQPSSHQPLHTYFLPTSTF